MKLKTHYVFSTGLISLLLSLLFSLNFYYNLFIAFYSSFLGNTLIDRIGHKEMLTRRGYIPVRTPLTHTLPRSIGWGLVVILPLLYLIYETHYGYSYYYDDGYYYSFLPVIISGILVGPSHMLLDVFTENGIYIKKNGKWRRYALAHFKYDNIGINGLAIFLGFLMLLASYYFSYHY
ncbi:DUF1286 domain-containing protein [Sulfurisphaera javensis]|uniref:DUF1286 domain-containing protein n=1 Tax=Sulfurisphaera javensis TaxID=2049879 RepID=A0AAT9GN50_9CREN